MKSTCAYAAVVCLALFLGGCASFHTNGASATPTVSISASPASISPGGSATLTVSASNATQVTVNGSDGSSYAIGEAGGAQKVSPSSTTTYTATATGASGDASAQTVVTVNSVAPAAPAPAVTIAANPATITAGNTSTLTITATNATQVAVTGSDGSSYTLSPTGGTQKVGPSQTTTYTATATGAGGSATSSVAITVSSAPVAPAPTVAIAANPASITAGSSSTLTITATNATQVAVTGSDGSSYTLSPSGGTQAVSPAQTTTYSAAATGAGGSAQATTTVTVSAVSISANPTTIVASASSTLTVAASNATAVTVTGTDGSSYTFSPTGGMQDVSPSQNTTYTAVATTASGKVSSSVSVRVTPLGSLNDIQHIVFTMQENHSFDQYFGALRDYWAENGYPDESLDGLPQFNPTIGAAPLYGPPPTNPSCNPNTPPPKQCVYDPNNPVASFHLRTTCLENTEPSWTWYHVEWDVNDPLGFKPAKVNGFVETAAYASRDYHDYSLDVNGLRAMGYYDGGDLNYYYFMASNFATSDRWFQSVMTKTGPNRYYLIAGTSQGYVDHVGEVPQDKKNLTAPTIFEELQKAGISWKIYVNTEDSPCTGPPYDPACLVSLSYISDFTWGHTVALDYPQNIAPVSQYFTDVENGTLPQVAEIEVPFHAPLDEHPDPTNDLQNGVQYVSTLINALMQSSSWNESAFILTYDEPGGFYDHVSPQPAVSPDGIKPVDIQPYDACGTSTGPLCDFVWTGYRVPLLVVSPFTKRHYVSHTVADFTAILKLIETRFNLPPLTKRDAAQMDMTEFFDFNNPPWMTPPTPPVQNTSGVCNDALVP